MINTIMILEEPNLFKQFTSFYIFLRTEILDIR